MVKKEKKSSKKVAVERGPYLTKRILISAAKRGFREAAAETMAIMGYNVITQGSWVVKKYADGRIEKISRLDMTYANAEIRLD